MKKKIQLKNSEVPKLQNYEKNPGDLFWKSFPKKDLPVEAETSVNPTVVEAELNKVKNSLTKAEFERGQRAIEYLKKGAPSFIKQNIQGCMVENAMSANRYGAEVTDNIATWIKKGFAAGPFDTPPLPEFRVNPLIAVAQTGKVRPVLDVSRPEGKSLNSAVDDLQVEKVKMTSAKIFGDVLLKAGKNAVFSKTDLVAAYKQVPCQVKNLRLQGFKWLEKYLVETRQIFGAKTSVANFDIVGETLRVIAIAQSGIPREFTLRQLDDLIVVAPESDESGRIFSQCYEKLCRESNVELAESCNKCEKAFTNQKRGKVLGILFDSCDMTWSLPDDKRKKCLDLVQKALDNGEITLLELQQLHGRINDVGQMCPFLKIFKQPLNKCLATESKNPEDVVKLSEEAVSDLLVWAGFLQSKLKWLPICALKSAPPLRCTTFCSDAAGLSVDGGSQGTDPLQWV